MALASTMRILGLVALGALCGTAEVHAQIKQPNGTAIPVTDNFRRPLNGMPVCFVGGCTPSIRTQQLTAGPPPTYVNENIQSINNYQTEPQQFAPLCNFSVRYIYKGGGAHFGIGWYNVNKDDGSARTVAPVYKFTKGDINTTASDSDINLLVPFTIGGADVDDNSLNPPINVSVAGIINDPRYKKGLIGMALIPKPVDNGTCCVGAAGSSCLASCATAACCGTGNGGATQYHYTEQKWNVHCTACTGTPGGPWFSHLIYRSTILDNTFYLGFEDLDFKDDPVNGVNGNDLDYDDFTFQFTGLSCPGAGQPCVDNTKQGACQTGVTDCNAQGAIYCKNLIQPGQASEVCDGIDNDCNGTADDGAPCPVGQVCDRGHCTQSCSSEFPCAGSFICSAGHCIDEACAGVNCGATQVCRNGSCANPCDGIVCPAPTVCSSGTCIDPCTDSTTGNPVVCKDKNGNVDPKKVCINGACVATCDCQPCSKAGQSCDMSTGKCVETACVGVPCGSGDQCSGGVCVAACTGATCPTGQSCQSGRCVLPCNGTCKQNEICNSGVCVNPCSGVTCGDPLVCQNGVCVNPCDTVICDTGQICDSGNCVAMPDNGGTTATGCGCRLAAGETGSNVLALGAAFMLLGWVMLRRRRYLA